jgi:ABC-type branched-subunit amino acid transport system substrate-binding protein
LLAAGGVIKASEVFGSNAKSVLDSMGISPEYDLSRLDSCEYPAAGLQAIYIPIAGAEEIGVVSAQLVYFNIPAQLIGSGEWNDLTELDEHKSYCTGLIFESDTYIDTSSAAYHEFVSGYRARFQKPPSRNAFFGYDTADLVLAQIRRGAATRQGLARALAAVGSYPGLHSRIGFGEERVNFWLNILQYDGSAIRRLDEIPLE